jgi:hypothetical protein
MRRLPAHLRTTILLNFTRLPLEEPKFSAIQRSAQHHYWLQADTLIEEPLACVPEEFPANRK